MPFHLVGCGDSLVSFPVLNLVFFCLVDRFSVVLTGNGSSRYLRLIPFQREHSLQLAVIVCAGEFC